MSYNKLSFVVVSKYRFGSKKLLPKKCVIQNNLSCVLNKNFLVSVQLRKNIHIFQLEWIFEKPRTSKVDGILTLCSLKISVS